jgi:hypothetical protein
MPTSVVVVLDSIAAARRALPMAEAVAATPTVGVRSALR